MAIGTTLLSQQKEKTWLMSWIKSDFSFKGPNLLCILAALAVFPTFQLAFFSIQLRLQRNKIAEIWQLLEKTNPSQSASCWGLFLSNFIYPSIVILEDCTDLIDFQNDFKTFTYLVRKSNLESPLCLSVLRFLRRNSHVPGFLCFLCFWTIILSNKMP